MSYTWKSVLYEYVRNRNQMEVDYSLQPVLPLISDENYINSQTARLNRLLLWHLERKTKPERSETRVQVHKIFERDNKVAVEMELRKKQLYSSNDFEEERVEKERVTLTRKNNNWTISKIEVVNQERQPAYVELNALTGPSQISASEIESAFRTKSKSTPYLNQHILSHSDASARSIRYDRIKVQQYADTWWNQSNPAFIHYDVDCTNFVSQCLYAGGIPMNYTGRRESGWWYKGRSQNQELWSFSWSVAHSLQLYLSNSRSGLQAEAVNSPNQLTIGDVIIYDWDGDSKYQHSTIVTAMDGNGFPLVNAHTSNTKHRYWDYRDSYAWNENTKYRFFHIVDSL